MACQRYEAELRETALGASAPSRLEIHLQACPGCRGELEEERALLRAIDHGLEAGLALEPSPGFASRVRRAVERDRPPSWFPFAAGWAALAMAVGLFVLGFPVREPPLPDAPPQIRGVDLAERETGVPMARPSPLRREAVPARPRSPGAEPEVMVSAAQAKTLLQYRTALHRGLIAPRTARAAAEAASAEQAELQIDPLVVAPLPAPEWTTEDGESRREERRSS